MGYTRSEIEKEQLAWLQQAFDFVMSLLPSIVANPGATVMSIASVVHTSLCRPGWPGALLSSMQRLALKGELLEEARALHYSKDKGAMSQFAKRAAKAAVSKVPASHWTHTMPAMNPRSGFNMGYIKQALEKELSFKNDQEHALAVTTGRILRTQRNLQRSLKSIDLPTNDPLRKLLSLPSTPHLALPKHDIRVHLLGCKELTLLKEAAPFSIKTMARALGEKLYERVKPVGFSDKYKRVVLAEVASSSAAHELSFHKQEILHRLKAIPGLEQIADIRFFVKSQAPA